MSGVFFPGGSTKLAGVMGWPVSHSLSPRLHNYWLRHHGMDGVYVALAVEPTRLATALLALPSLGFRGVNLTIPHKEAAMRIVDHVAPLARRVGAINTVTVRPDGSLEGSNTDVLGFIENLKNEGYRTFGGTAVVLGSGGAARAVVAGLLDEGCLEIRLVNRTRERAELLARDFGPAIKLYSWRDVGRAMIDAMLLVNTTSLGMEGQPPLDIDVSSLPAEAFVTDIVYAPLETNLLRRARARNLRVVDGLGMLLHQARPGFETWFGVAPKVTPDLRRFVLERS